MMPAILLYLCTASGLTRAANLVNLVTALASNASQPILGSFVSFSIEFAFFPDFAGNLSAPNEFSNNLIQNIGKLQGRNPIIRVGGNTQDYSLFNSSQQAAVLRSSNSSTTITIGPTFFESYNTWENVSFIHGFNLAKNGTSAISNIKETVPLVCQALNGTKLAYWQLGNEPDLYKTSAQGPVRPSWWNETDYVDEWLNKTELIQSLVQQNCPDVLQRGKFNFYSPSFAGIGNSLNMISTWKAGLDDDKDVGFIDCHNYIGDATKPGVSLQGTLMNHTATVLSVNKQLNQSTNLRNYTDIPYIFGEANSLYNGGPSGLSNSFGAALWGVDFNLYCAATGIGRVHMHQVTNHLHASWQPIDTANVTKGTKAPYYGNIMVAAMLGNLTGGNTTISDLEQDSIYDSAYAAYVNGQLLRLAVIQMREYNYSGNSNAVRPFETFSFQLPIDSHVKLITVQRLLANGSDAITGITFGGYSYNYELDEGRPVLMSNVTRAETLGIGSDGVLSLQVPWSSAAIINFI